MLGAPEEHSQTIRINKTKIYDVSRVEQSPFQFVPPWKSARKQQLLEIWNDPLGTGTRRPSLQSSVATWTRTHTHTHRHTHPYSSSLFLIEVLFRHHSINGSIVSLHRPKICKACGWSCRLCVRERSVLKIADECRHLFAIRETKTMVVLYLSRHKSFLTTPRVFTHVHACV